MRHAIGNSAWPTRRWIAAVLVACSAIGGSLHAQQRPATAQNPAAADYLYEPDGYLVEPDAITRAAIYADRHFGKGDLNNGLYIDFANMVAGAGWIAAGPGYRRWYSKDQLLIDASAGVSWHGYKMAQARVELPKLMRSRLLLGGQAKLQDFTQIKFYGEGPAARAVERERLSAEVERRRRLCDAAAGRMGRRQRQRRVAGAVDPQSPAASSGTLSLPCSSCSRATRCSRVTSPPSCTPRCGVSADRRDYPGHPTRGGLVRGAITGYADRDAGLFSFRRYEAEAEHFVPFDGARMVLALHGWVASTQTDLSQIVPFYLEPSIGGQNSLRSFPDFRFHDRNLALVNVEARIAVFSHMDAAVFVDAGNVAPRFGDLNLDKRSYGVGARFHTRREDVRPSRCGARRRRVAPGVPADRAIESVAVFATDGRRAVRAVGETDHEACVLGRGRVGVRRDRHGLRRREAADAGVARGSWRDVVGAADRSRRARYLLRTVGPRVAPNPVDTYTFVEGSTRASISG